MKKQLALWGTTLLVGLLLAGCKNDTTGPDVQTTAPGVTDEVSAMQYLAATDPFVTNDEETFSDKAVEAEDYGTFGKIDASIIPIRYGRFINSVDRTETVNVLPGDSLAIVNVQKTIHGTFAIMGKYLPSDTSFTLIQKPFVDHSSRRLLFKRFSRAGALTQRWVTVGASLVNGATVPPADTNFQAIKIVKLQFFAATDTVTITDPDTTFLRFNWAKWYSRPRWVPEMRGGERFVLQATVVSASPDTDRVNLRFGAMNLFKKRIHLNLVSQVQNGDNTFTRVYETPNAMYIHFHSGLFNMGVDAATKGTIYDDKAPYSVSWWGMPYRVF